MDDLMAEKTVDMRVEMMVLILAEQLAERMVLRKVVKLGKTLAVTDNYLETTKEYKKEDMMGQRMIEETEHLMARQKVQKLVEQKVDLMMTMKEKKMVEVMH